MSHREHFWMACDSIDNERAEYGPFNSRDEAEREARSMGFGFLLRYEHVIGDNDDILEVRSVFVELNAGVTLDRVANRTLHTRCASCGQAATHENALQAEVWADIHEFEHSRHRVRLFEHSQGAGLLEVGDWRKCA